MPAIGTEFCWKLLGVPASASQMTDTPVWLGQFALSCPFLPYGKGRSAGFIDQLIAFVGVRTHV